MRQYFVNEPVNLNCTVSFDDKQAHHIRDVLRMRNGDKIRVVDSNSYCYMATISIDASGVYCLPYEVIDGNDDSKDIIYCAAMIKKDKWDIVLQKATELGATKIVPLITSKTIIQLDEKEVEKKLIRWNKITLEASQQSNRTKVCEVVKPIKLKNIAQYMSEVNLVPYENEDNTTLLDLVDERSITFVIGPEGGISKDEIEFLNKLGFTSVTLGKRILRAETAGLYTLSVIDAKRNIL